MVWITTQKPRVLQEAYDSINYLSTSQVCLVTRVEMLNSKGQTEMKKKKQVKRCKKCGILEDL